MSLVRSILKGVADDRALENHVLVASPVRDLIEQYNKLAQHNDNLPKITATSTGRNLKHAVGLLEAEDQVALLNNYTLATKSIDVRNVVREDPETSDQRQMRLFMFKVFVVLFAVFCCVMVGVTITVAVKSGSLPNGGVLESVITTVGEIIKLILSSPPK